MIKLLVNAPSGRQEVIMVDATGGYFDPERVIWDERIDGPMPSITLGGMVRVGGELAFDSSVMASVTVSDLAAAEAKRIASIDAQILAIEGQVTPRRIREVCITGDNTFIANIENQIAQLRAQRKG